MTSRCKSRAAASLRAALWQASLILRVLATASDAECADACCRRREGFEALGWAEEIEPSLWSARWMLSAEE